MKKIMLLSSLVLFMVSCESDSIENTNAVITGYKLTSSTDYPDPALPDYTRIVIGNLSNGKLFSETTEEFVNGVSQGGAVTQQLFFYSNNRLEHRIIDDLTVYYYYDTNGNLIGATGVFYASPSSPGTSVYERYTHQSNNVIFCERTSLPYNDPNAVASQRKILQLNSNGDVISAGLDLDMDGLANQIYTYSYNNGNLVSVQRPDGTIVNFSYSNVLDTYQHLLELSCGKQVLQFPCAGIYASITGSELKYSKNVTSDDFSTSAYLIMPDGFYNKKTSVDLLNNHTQEMEFFFN